jgi:hypothetical protein
VLKLLVYADIYIVVGGTYMRYTYMRYTYMRYTYMRYTYMRYTYIVV